MKPENLETINRSFEIQAHNFESSSVQFTKADYLNYTVSAVSPGKDDMLLEAAAGTCVCGRSFAPHVHTVVCLDATTAMLKVGAQEARKEGLGNIVFVKGCVEELPFLDESFDIVFSRLAFHHFADVKTAFAEMLRVLRPRGKLVMIDMAAADEGLRNIEDSIERMRDPSHVKNLSRDEMAELFTSHGLLSVKGSEKEIEQNLKSWMTLTKTPTKTRQTILSLMEEDIAGGRKTGFSPYYLRTEICFRQHWVLTMGYK